MKTEAMNPLWAILLNRDDRCPVPIIRCISAQTPKDWRMGYAPPYGDMLPEWAPKRKYTENLLVTAGLLTRPEENFGRR